MIVLMGNKTIIFFGELPPKTIHGASISNFINLKILERYFKVIKIEEFSNLKYHNKFSLNKVHSFIGSILNLTKILFKKKGDIFYSVIYLSSFGIFKNIFTIFLFKIFNTKSKVILHFHRSDFKIFINYRINCILFYLLDTFVDEYIVLSQKQKNDFPFKSNLSVLYNTIQFELPIINYSDQKEDYILFIGNYIKEKGLLDLIYAVKKYNFEKSKKLKLICHGNIVSKSFFKLVTEAVGDDLYITINGPINGEKKMDCIKNAKYTILPSFNEGLPLTLLESMSVGTPIIITKVGYISEVLGNDYPLYCNVSDIDSIYDSFLKFDDIEDKLTFKNNLIMTYKNRFSVEIHEKELLRIFLN
jgi:glycosyltransferase involved in cell wall biosynthesis